LRISCLAHRSSRLAGGDGHGLCSFQPAPRCAGAAITGLLAGVWLTISLEGLMLVAAFSGLMAWRFVWLGSARWPRFWAAPRQP
jgi:hypothetical protein